MPFAKVEEAVAAIGRGEIVVVVDDEDRENEGDLIMAAEFATPEAIAFFLQHTSGVICAPVTSARARELDLPPMVQQNTESQRTAFLVTVDCRHGTTTGISAADRAATIQALVDPAHPARRPAPPRPHLPARGARGRRPEARRAHRGRRRPGPPGRAATPPACCARSSTRRRTRWPACRTSNGSADEHGLLLISIADLIRYRRQTEKLVRRLGEATHPHAVGRLHAARLRVDPRRRAAHRLRAGRRAARRTCSSGCTASASPATCSVRCAATADRSSTRRCR